jgi:hypothetical protein
MASTDSKFEKIQQHFQTLSAVATSLNTASDELSKVIDTFDEALKQFRVGLTVWAPFRFRDAQPPEYDQDEIGYTKIDGSWGIALRHTWGDEERDEHHESGPWHFNDAPRNLRLIGVDAIPLLIEALSKEAAATTKQVQEKTKAARELAGVIEKISKTPKSEVATERRPTTPQSVMSAEDALKHVIFGPFVPSSNKAKGK